MRAVEYTTNYEDEGEKVHFIMWVEDGEMRFDVRDECYEKMVADIKADGGFWGRKGKFWTAKDADFLDEAPYYMMSRFGGFVAPREMDIE